MLAGLEGVDFARPSLRPDAAVGADDPGRRGQAAHRRALIVDLRENLGHGVEIRPIEAMINHNTTEVFFDNLQCGELLLVVGYMARSNLTSLPGDPVPHDLVRAMISVNNSSVVRWRQ